MTPTDPQMIELATLATKFKFDFYYQYALLLILRLKFLFYFVSLNSFQDIDFLF